jgi:putative CocE/NonD family hydrolase
MLQWSDVQSFPYDMKDIEARPDVLTFTSDPLPADLTIAGEVSARLYASTDAKDTDWWIHLSDVDPQGASHRITQGMVRARFRHNEDPQHRIFGANFETERLLSGDPGEVVEYRIGIRSIANTFKAGHRIRIAIMNAVDNYSFPNSNTGRHEGYVTETVVGSMAIHHSAAHPSSITVPVVRR